MLFPVLVALASGCPLGLSCRRSLESKDWTESFFQKMRLHVRRTRKKLVLLDYDRLYQIVIDDSS